MNNTQNSGSTWQDVSFLGFTHYVVIERNAGEILYQGRCKLTALKVWNELPDGFVLRWNWRTQKYCCIASKRKDATLQALSESG